MKIQIGVDVQIVELSSDEEEVEEGSREQKNILQNDH
jgi:hypothetical protein